MKRMNFIFSSGALIFLLLVVGSDIAAAGDKAYGGDCKVEAATAPPPKADCKTDGAECQKDTAGVMSTCADGDAACKCMCKDKMKHNTGTDKCEDGDGTKVMESTEASSAMPVTGASEEKSSENPITNPPDVEATTSGSDRVAYEPASLKLGMAAIGSFLVLLLSSS